MKLFTATNEVYVPNLIVARSLKDRLVGLLGRSELPEGEGLWILRSPSIHTFFMRFPIDVVFVDRKMKVKAIYKNVVPWRWILPVWGADSVIELPAGTVTRKVLQVGDQLNVGH